MFIVVGMFYIYRTPKHPQSIHTKYHNLIYHYRVLNWYSLGNGIGTSQVDILLKIFHYLIRHRTQVVMMLLNTLFVVLYDLYISTDMSKQYSGGEFEESAFL